MRYIHQFSPMDRDPFHISIKSFWKDEPLFNFEMAESSLFSLFREDNSCCVALRELYSSSDMITTPESLPLLMISVSKFSVTRSRYFLISFLKSEIDVVNIFLYFVRNFVQIYVLILNFPIEKEFYC